MKHVFEKVQILGKGEKLRGRQVARDGVLRGDQRPRLAKYITLPCLKDNLLLETNFYH